MSTPPSAGVLLAGASPACAAVCAPAESGTPYSNHGVRSCQTGDTPDNSSGESSRLGIWDYVTITCSRAALVSRSFAGFTEDENGELIVIPGEVERRCHGADEDHATGKVLAPAIVDWLLPGHALTPHFFEPKGWQGYKQSAQLYAPGIATPVGVVAREGNGDTVCISISGSGMFAVDLPRARLALEHYGARITRIDAAFDDLEGQRIDIDALRRCASFGLFDSRGKPASRSFIDDLGSGTGCSLYVGRKGDKQLNVYEKGKQKGDPNSPWVRAEVRLWAKNRVLPLSMLDSPLGAILGAYPRLRAWLPDAAPSRARSVRRMVEADAGQMHRWLKSAAGKSIGMMRDAAAKAGISDGQLLDLVSRKGMPDRFGGVPDVVAIHRTAKYLEEAMP